MACKHKRIKSVNCVIFCEDCGERLTVDKLPEPEPEKKPAKRTRKKTSSDPA